MLDNKHPADPPLQFKNRGEGGEGARWVAVKDERRDKWRGGGGEERRGIGRETRAAREGVEREKSERQERNERK